MEYDCEPQVARDAEVVLKTMHDKISVQNVDGDYDVSVVNGGVDLWIQPGLAADLRCKIMHGEVYTDFPFGAAGVGRQRGAA